MHKAISFLSFRALRVSVPVLIVTGILFLNFGPAFAATTGNLFPTANGVYQQWNNQSGTGWAELNETSNPSCVSTDAIIENSSNQRSSYAVSLSTVPDGSTITSMDVTVSYRSDSASPNNGGTFKTFARVNAVDTDAAADLSATGTNSSPCSHTSTQTINNPDVVKSSGTTLEIGVLKTSANTNAVRVGAISVVITYTLPTTGTLTIVKNAGGGNGTFTWALSGTTTVPSITTVGNTGTKNIAIAPGTYSLTENAQAGWNLIGSSCTSGTPASFTIVAGNTITCTFNNAVPSPDLTVTKTNDVGGLVSVGGSYNWTITITNSGTLPASFSNTNVVLTDNLPNAGATYGAPIVTNGAGTTGTTNCSITGVSPFNMSCVANGAISIPAGGTITIVVPVTTTAGGTLANPRAGGVCTVDPGLLVAETSEVNNSCSDSVGVTQSDLTITKTNNVSGSANLGTPFNWILTISNTLGTGAAIFSTGQVILTDNLPSSGATYGTPVAAGTGSTTGVPANVSCNVVANDLVCTATGAVSIPVGSTMTVTVPTTPTVVGSLTNPRSLGVCNVDTSNAISEQAEGNNTCASNSVTVAKANTTAIVSAGTLSTATVVGQSYPVAFTVTSPAGGTPTGNVTVTDGSQTCVATVAVGTCDLVSTTVGSPKSIKATYAGDASYNASPASTGVNHTVSKAATTATVNAGTLGTATVVGQSYPVSFSVTVNAPGAGTPTGNVTISDGVASCTGTVAAGTCNLTSTSVGTKSITASYVGDTNFLASGVSASASHTVNKTNTTTTINSDTPDPSVTGQVYNVTYSVVATAPGAGTATGNVTVSDGTDSCTGTVAAGTCALTSTTLGAKTLVATYAGDTNFNTSASVGTSHSVNPPQPDLTVGKTSSTGSTATNGESFNYVLTINNGGTATATFTTSQTILSDTLQSSGTPIYGTPVAVNGGSTTGVVACAIDGSNILTCIASGGNVVIPVGSTIVVTVPITLVTTTTQVNPKSGGSCSVDPSAAVTESNEGNNSCTTVNVTVSANQKSITSATVGGGTFVTVAPSATIASITFLTNGTGSSDWLSTAWSIGTDPLATKACVNTPDHTSSGNYSEGFNVTAPAAPGTYNLYLVAYSDNTCGTSPSAIFTLANAVVVKGNQTITVNTPAPASAAYNSTFDVAATASSLLPVAITTTGSCSGSGSGSATVTMTSGAGSCVVHYNQSGSASFNAASEVTNTISATKLSQIITFDPLSAKTYGDADFGVSAISDSGLPVAFNSETGVCTISGSTVHIVSAGSCTIRASQAGDANHSAASNVDQSFSINKANAIISVTPYSVAFNGVGHTALGSATGVFGENLSGLDLSGTAHTNAGTFLDTWTFTDVTGNYNNATDAVSDSISKNNADCSSITGYSGVYDAATHAATGSCKDINGDDLAGLNLGTSFTNAPGGTADWIFTDVTGNYNDSSGSVAIDISKKTASVTPSADAKVYGQADPVLSGSLSGFLPSDSVTASYARTSGESVSASPYTISATLSPVGVLPNYDITYNTANFTITKATADCSSITGYSLTYDGNSHTATGSCVGTGLDGALAGLDLSNTTHLAAGTFNGDTWTFTDVSGNYSNDSGTVDDSITKAEAVCTISGYSGVYDGLAHGATGSCTGVGGELSGLTLGSSFTDVPGGVAHWAFTNSNYANQSGDVPIVISKANANITVGTYEVTYDGSEHIATGSALGVLGESLVGLDLDNTKHTSVGNFTDTWNFTDVTGNYNDATDTVNDTINAAIATCTISGYSGVYDGLVHGATGSCTGIGGELSGLTLGSSFTDVPGGTAHWSFTNSNYGHQEGDVAINITALDLVGDFTADNKTYDGNTSAVVLTRSLTGVIAPDDVTLIGGTATFADSLAGVGKTVTLSGASLAGLDASNYNLVSVNATTANIEKAGVTCLVNGYTGIYDGLPHGATGTCTGIGDVDLSSSLDLGVSFTNVPGGTGHWTFHDPAGNYADQTGTVEIVISKHALDITAQNQVKIYGAEFTPIGTEFDSVGLQNGETIGSVTLTSTGFAADAAAGPHNIDPSAAMGGTFNADNYILDYHNGVITIGKADAEIDAFTTYDVTYDGLPHTATGSALGFGGVVLAGLDLSGTTHTNVGDYTADAWTFHDVTGNYNDASGTLHNHIASADATCTITGYTGAYDSVSHGATGSCKGVNDEVLAGLDLGVSYTNAPGGPANWTFTDVTGNYNNADGTVGIVIDQTNQTITFDPLSNKHLGDGDFDIVAIGGASGNPVTFGALGSCEMADANTVHMTNTGSCTIQADQSGNANYGNAASVQQSFTIVNDAPVAVDDYDITNQNIPLITLASVYSGNDTDSDGPSALAIISVYNPIHGSVSLSSGTITFTPDTDFSGAASFDYSVTDGNASDVGTVHVQINDVTAPETTIDTHPTDPSNSSNATFTFSSSEGGAFTCQIDSEPTHDCTSGNDNFPAVTEGAHVFTVFATDAAGNPDPTPAVYHWTVDTAGPTVVISSPVNGGITGTSSVITYSTGDATGVICKLDSSEVPCNLGTGMTVPFGPFADATSHTFEVTATDLAGNSGSDSITFHIDGHGPVATITSPNTDPMGSIATTNFTSDEAAATFGCQLDVQAFACSPNTPVIQDPLTDGIHTFSVQGIDLYGNVGPVATYQWTVDTSGPTVSITAPTSSVTSKDITILYVVGDSTSVSCTLDGVAEGCDLGGSHSLINLTNGSHTFTLQGFDSLNNSGNVASVTWTVDRTGPDTLIISGPAGTVETSDATFEFSSEAGAMFKCALDGGVDTDCTSPLTYHTLSNGEHTFAVYAIDTFGNIGDPDSRTWTVDATPPTITNDISADATADSVTITWDTLGHPATSRVVWDGVAGNHEPLASTTCSSPTTGSFQCYGYLNTTDVSNTAPKVTSHSVTVSGLSAGTTYHFRAVSKGSPEGTGTDITVTTDQVIVTPSTGTFVVVKKIIGGTITDPSQFKFELNSSDGTTSPQSFDATGTSSFEVAPGIFNVTETASTSPYAIHYDNCKKVSVVAGQTATCVVTNTYDINAQHQQILLKKFIIGDPNATPDMFSYQVSRQGESFIATFPSGGEIFLSGLSHVPHSIIELPAPNYIATYASDVEGHSNDCNDIPVDVDGSHTCTITNTKIGTPPVDATLTITKDVVASDGTTDVSDNHVFQVTVGSETKSVSEGSPAVFTLAPGTYTVTEGTDADYELVSILNDEDLEQAGIQAVLGAGGNVGMLIINKQKAIVVPPATTTGTIIIQKNTDDTANNGTFTFTGLENASITTVNGYGEQAFSNLLTGPYSIAEVAQSGWNLVDASCTNGDSQDEILPSVITLSSGEIVTCVFNNAKVIDQQETGKVLVIKKALGGNGTFDFTGTLGAFSITTHHHYGINFMKDVPVGPYSVSESAQDGWNNIVNTCSDLTVTANHTSVCWVINKKVNTPPPHLQEGSIKVIKKTVGGNGTFSFEVAERNFTITTHHGAGSKTISHLTPGTYSVSETPKEGWTTLNECDDVVVTSGHKTTCTITNTKIQHHEGDDGDDDGDDHDGGEKGTLIVTKTLVGGEDDTFSFTGDAGSFMITTHEGTGHKTIKHLDAGTYSISEVAHDGWSEDDSACQNVEIVAGETTHCTVTNTVIEQHDEPGTLIIEKQTNMGDATFTFGVTGHNNVTVTTASSSGSSESISLAAGEYDVTENALTGWDFGSVSCSYADESTGSVITNGEHITIESGDEVTCTFHNTKHVDAAPADECPSGQHFNDAHQCVPVDPTCGVNQHLENHACVANHVDVNSNTGGGNASNSSGSSSGGNGPIVGSYGGGGNGSSLPHGQVLGASTTTLPELPAGCNALLGSYMRRGNKKNNADDVKALQKFLNDEMHSNLPISGFFGPMTDKAVKEFQQFHSNQILTPWSLNAPTGFVYKTTQRWINLVHCGSLNIPMPDLTPYSGE